MQMRSIRGLAAILAWGLIGLVLLLGGAFTLAVVSAGLHPDLVAREHTALLAGGGLTGPRAVALVLAGALPLPAALYGLWQGVVLLRHCQSDAACLPTGAAPLRNLALGFAATVLLGFANEPLQAMLIAGRDGFIQALADFDPGSDSLGLFILALVVALVGQSSRAGES